MTPAAVLVLVTGLAVVVLQHLVHRALVELTRAQPALCRRVGLVHVDWWLACLRAAFALAFGRHRRELPARTRQLLQAFWLSLPAFTVAVAAALFAGAL